MKKSSLPLALISFVFSIFLFPFFANADYVVKKNKQTTEIVSNSSNQNSRKNDGTIWISKNKMRQDDGSATSIIIRLDKKTVFILNHVEKTYSEMQLPLKLEENLTSEAKQIIQMMKISSAVTETQETQMIKGWKSQKFLADISISMMGMDMPMTMEIWATKETGIDLKAFRKFYDVLLSMNPFTKDLVEEFKKIEGYPVLTKISMRVKGVETKSQEEVITIEESRAPRGTYDLPPEYSRVAYDPLILGNGQFDR
jgi:hypothetical protein